MQMTLLMRRLHWTLCCSPATLLGSSSHQGDPPPPPSRLRAGPCCDWRLLTGRRRLSGAPSALSRGRGWEQLTSGVYRMSSQVCHSWPDVGRICVECWCCVVFVVCWLSADDSSLLSLSLNMSWMWTIVVFYVKRLLVVALTVSVLVKQGLLVGLLGNSS